MINYPKPQQYPQYQYQPLNQQPFQPQQIQYNQPLPFLQQSQRMYIPAGFDYPPLNYQQQQQNSYQQYQQQQQTKIPDNEQQFLQEAIETKEVVHEVSASDTLWGLSLQYGVPPETIKKYNELQSDEIYCYKILKIPNPTSYIVSSDDPLEAEKQQKIIFFKSEMEIKDQKDSKMAKFYLEEANYDLSLALKTYKEDNVWEEKYKKQNGNNYVLGYQPIKDKKIK